MAAAAAASSVPVVKVCAFIMTHGQVKPEINDAMSHIDPPDSQQIHYTVTATPLPANITLYAPAILGYSYFEDKKTEDIITKVGRWLKPIHEDIANTFLRYLQDYVKFKISRLNQHLCAETLPHGDDRTDRLEKQETLTVRSQMEWREHQHYIEEKKYIIYPDDEEKDPLKKFPSCIMIYCDNVRKDIMKTLNETFNAPNTTYFSEHNQITYTVTYDKASSTFKIDFGDTKAQNVSLDDIIFLIKNLVFTVSPPGTTFDKMMLSIFDMTCDDFSFPNIDAANETAVLLSSVYSKGDPTLVFGTILEGRAAALELQTQTRWPSWSSGDGFWNSYQSGVESVSPSPSYSSSRSRSPILRHFHSLDGMRPSKTHIVHLLHGVESFVNFRLLSECQPSLLSSQASQSVSSTKAFESPSASPQSSYDSDSSSRGGPAMLLGSDLEHSIPRLGGGNRRSRRRSRRRRTKKVYRKNARKSNRRRNTKARSRQQR